MWCNKTSNFLYEALFLCTTFSHLLTFLSIYYGRWEAESIAKVETRKKLWIMYIMVSISSFTVSHETNNGNVDINSREKRDLINIIDVFVFHNRRHKQTWAMQHRRKIEMKSSAVYGRQGFMRWWLTRASMSRAFCHSDKIQLCP